MNRVVKLNCSGVSIVFLLICIIPQFKQHNDGNTLNIELTDKQEIVSFIEQNLSKLSLEYNKHFNQKWNPTSVENKCNITINDGGSETTGIFLDFNSNNGYAVIGDNLILYDIQTAGESPFLGIASSSYFYSNSYGYYYLMDGDYVSVNKFANKNNDFESAQLTGSHYLGQPAESKGCGDIDDPSLYVNDKYGTGWTLEKSKSLNMDGYTQLELSCYLKHKIEKDKATSTETVGVYSEGNCWFVSAYNVIRFLQQRRWLSMPSKSIKAIYTPSSSEPNLYSKFYDEYGYNKSKKLYYNNKSSWVYERYLSRPTFDFEQLYIDVRQLLNEKYKKVDGGTINETSAVIERIAKKYGYTVDAQENTAWAPFIDSVTQNIDSLVPFLWSTSCDTYGSHTMAVCGYRYYSRTTGWWIFKSKESKVFYEIRDGWSNSPKYFDISGYAGFAAFITLKF